MYIKHMPGNFNFPANQTNVFPKSDWQQFALTKPAQSDQKETAASN